MFHSCWLELLAWEVGDMWADITGRVERRIWVQGEKRDGFDFSPTAQFGQLTSLVYLLQTPALLQPLAVSIPPNIGPFRDWLEGCDSFPLRSLLELTTETCQHAHPHPDPCLVFLPLTILTPSYDSWVPPWPGSPLLTDSPLPGGKQKRNSLFCGTHPAYVLLFYFIFMFNLYCLLGLG